MSRLAPAQYQAADEPAVISLFLFHFQFPDHVAAAAPRAVSRSDVSGYDLVDPLSVTIFSRKAFQLFVAWSSWSGIDRKADLIAKEISSGTMGIRSHSGLRIFAGVLMKRKVFGRVENS